MSTITVEIEGKREATRFAAFIKNLKYVKSVKITFGTELKPLTEDDWVRPTRRATDEELINMIKESEAEYEAGLVIPLEESRKRTIEYIKSLGLEKK
ncbi:MAG: hypothetical protein HW421_2825 [Ignavibacteria bacterium]|nr:hypothetical protein [Ignavibacteria bacterium]